MRMCSEEFELVKECKAGFWGKKGENKKKARLSQRAKEVGLVIFDPPRAKRAHVTWCQIRQLTQSGTQTG